MLEYFRDPAWQFVGAIFAFLAIAATIAIHLIQRQRKRLAYDLVSRNQLLTVKEELEGKLQVLFDGQPTRDICLLVVKIINNGNVAIASADYEKNIFIGTGASSKILSAAITEVDPENLAVDLVTQESNIQITPTLLNPRDSISLKLLVSDFAGKLAVDARVIGIKKIERVGATTGLHSLLMLVALVGMFSGMALMFYFDPKPEIKLPTPIEVKIGAALLISSYAMIFYTSLKNRMMRLVAKRLLQLVRG
jgi:hypothetical protein